MALSNKLLFTYANSHARRVHWTKHTRRALVVMALLGLVACGSQIDPASTGGERMLTVDGLDCSDERPMAISPAGKSLLFSVVRHYEDAGSPEKKLGVLSLTDGKVVFAEAANAATASMLSRGRYPPFPRLEEVCWSDDEVAYFPIHSRHFQAEGEQGRSLPTLTLQPDTNSNTLVFAPAGQSSSGVTDRAAASTVGFVVRLSEPSLLALAPVPADCTIPSLGQWRYGSWTFGKLDQPDIPVERRFINETVLNDDKTIRLVTQDGRLLAEHKTQNWGSDSISLDYFAWNPAGSHLAYLLSEGMSIYSSGPSQLWLFQSAQPEPVALVTGMSSLQWQDDRTLFSCGRIGSERQFSIVRWILPE